LEYIPRVSFRCQGQSLRIFTTKPLFEEQLKLKPMESIVVYFLITDKAIIAKFEQNIKQVKF